MNNIVKRDDGILPFRVCIESINGKTRNTIDYIEQKDIKKMIVIRGEKFIIHRGNRYKRYSITHLNSGYCVVLMCPLSSGIGTVEMFLEKEILEKNKKEFARNINKANKSCKKIINLLKKQKGVIVYANNKNQNR